jgi:hypothetical protein
MPEQLDDTHQADAAVQHCGRVRVPQPTARHFVRQLDADSSAPQGTVSITSARWAVLVIAGEPRAPRFRNPKPLALRCAFCRTTPSRMNAPLSLWRMHWSDSADPSSAQATASATDSRTPSAGVAARYRHPEAAAASRWFESTHQHAVRVDRSSSHRM